MCSCGTQYPEAVGHVKSCDKNTRIHDPIYDWTRVASDQPDDDLLACVI